MMFVNAFQPRCLVITSLFVFFGAAPTITLADPSDGFAYLYTEYVASSDRCARGGIDGHSPILGSRVQAMLEVHGYYCDETDYSYVQGELTARLGYDLLGTDLAFGPFVGGFGTLGTGRTKDRLNNFDYDRERLGTTVGIFSTYESDKLILRVIAENLDYERIATTELGFREERDFDFMTGSVLVGWKLNNVARGLTAFGSYRANSSNEDFRLGVGYAFGEE